MVSKRTKANTKQVLHLTLHREFFDAIAQGRKKTEYRADTTYWRSRLQGREYDEIVFRNGYLRSAPTMRVDCLGIRKDRNGDFAIKLGPVRAIIELPDRSALSAVRAAA